MSFTLQKYPHLSNVHEHDNRVLQSFSLRSRRLKGRGGGGGGGEKPRAREKGGEERTPFPPSSRVFRASHAPHAPKYRVNMEGTECTGLAT